MIAKFNPIGTHVHKGFLKVRIDLYPGIGDKTYSIHHVQVPVIPPEGYQGAVDARGSPVDQVDYDAWFDSLPKVWHLNPCLCHFISVDESITRQDLTNYVRSIFDKDTLIELDGALIKGNTLMVLQLIKGKVDIGKPVLGITTQKLSTLNTRLSGLEVEV